MKTVADSAHTTTTDMPAAIKTADRVESRLGTLTFKDGVPDDATAQQLFDEIDYVHAFEWRGVEHRQLCGRVGSIGPLSTPASPRFVDGTGKVMNTIPPSDFSFFEMLNEALQMQPAGVMDPEIAGHLAAIGIVKDKPFNPDARMKKILTEALAVANAASRAMSIGGRTSEGFGYYDDSDTVGLT